MSTLKWRRFCKNLASVSLVLTSLSACAVDKTYQDPPVTPESDPLAKVTFTIDSKGNISVNGVEGLSVKDCALDSESKDRCAIFDKKVQVEELQNIFFIRYQGSNCILYGSGKKAKSVCYP